MSQCKAIKNSLVYYPLGSTYCCVSGDRELFSFDNWLEKRESDLNEYERSKNDWLSSCMTCERKERVFGKSDRIIENHMLSYVEEADEKIHNVTIKTSNMCNLACRMCGPHASSKWQSIIRNNNLSLEQHNFEDATESDINFLKDNILTDTVSYLRFSGGEPMVSHWNTDILNYIIDNDLCKNISFSMTTNGTIFFKDEWIDSIVQFKEAMIGFSIDGYDSVFDYIRPGHSWDLLVNVLDDFREKTKQHKHIEISYYYVAQALNAHSFHDDKKKITELWDSYGQEHDFDNSIDICAMPSHLSYAVIPNILRTKYNIEYLADEMTFDITKTCKFMYTMGVLDKIHGTSLMVHNPDFFDTMYYSDDIIKYYYKGFIDE